MKTSRVLIAFAAAITPLTPLVVMANPDPPPEPSPPDECTATTSATSTFYNGYNAERQFLEGLWSSGGYDCVTMDDYIAAIDVALWPSATSLSLRCRASGMLAAIQYTIDAKIDQCIGPGGECPAAGDETGALNGEIYCKAKGDLLIPYSTTLCGLTFQQSCQSAMRAYVNANCKAKADGDPDFNSTVEMLCEL